MQVMTPALIAEAYRVSKDVYEGRRQRTAAFKHLARVGMQPGSAIMYVNALCAMLDGRTFTRTLNKAAFRYYLESVKRDYGHDRLEICLKSFEEHIEYYESSSGLASAPGLRALLEEFRLGVASNGGDGVISRSSSSGITRREAESAIEIEVASWLKRDLSSLTAALPPRGHRPERKVVDSFIYSRSPVVIAAALVRAQGRCETCGNPAPFRKRSDGQPYLEVHHKTRLSNGGADTLDNVVAVCPNCHREHHYG